MQAGVQLGFAQTRPRSKYMAQTLARRRVVPAVPQATKQPQLQGSLSPAGGTWCWDLCRPFVHLLSAPAIGCSDDLLGSLSPEPLTWTLTKHLIASPQARP